MERHFGLPVAFAAAAHAALLFAFDRPPVRVAAPVEKITVREFVLERPPEDVPIVEPVDSGRRESVPPPRPAAPPRSVEPLPLDPGTLPTMHPPPLQPPGEVDALAKEIPPPITPGRSGEGWGPGDVLSRDLLDNPPRTRFQAAPHYPFEGKTQGLHGEVVVEFLVDERGRVHEPRVVSSTHRMFEEPTLRAVAKWQFEPGRRDGRVVRFRMAAPVVFRLNE